MRSGHPGRSSGALCLSQPGLAEASGTRPRLIDREVAESASPFALLGTRNGAERCHLDRVLQTGLPTHLAEIEVTNAAGENYIVKQSFLPVLERDEIRGVIVVFRDVTAEARIQQRYRELLARERARADELTAQDRLIRRCNGCRDFADATASILLTRKTQARSQQRIHLYSVLTRVQ